MSIIAVMTLTMNDSHMTSIAQIKEFSKVARVIEFKGGLKKKYLNVYLNYHRPCAYATEIVNEKGKIKEVYKTYMTPYERLRSIEDARQYLKDEISFETLDKIANEKSGNEFAALMQKEKDNLFLSNLLVRYSGLVGWIKIDLNSQNCKRP